MSYPTDSSAQFDYASLTIIPSYSSITNPSILYNDGTSGIYNSAANNIIMYTSSTTAFKTGGRPADLLTNQTV
jgi:hypothetical protein